jgi:hypothetical protein
MTASSTNTDQRPWDHTLVTWMLHLADQGILLPANRMAPLIEGTDHEILACGCLLQYCRDELGWPTEIFPQMIASFCPGMFRRASMQFLASAWVYLYAELNQQHPPGEG